MQLLRRNSARIWRAARQFDAVQHMHGEWRLMLPVVCFAAGCAFQISAGIETPLHIIIASLLGCAAGGAVLRVPLTQPLLHGIIAFLIGLLTAEARIRSLDDPIVRQEHFAVVEGRVLQLEIRPEKAPRLTIAPTAIDKWTSPPPAKIRLLARGYIPEELQRDALVRVPAILRPPSGAIVPGGFDFGRRAYFQGIGGEGFVAGEIDILQPPPERVSLATYVGEVRAHIGHQLRALLPGQAGTVATALLVGDRGYIEDEVAQNFRDAGLAHLMAISGLHMGLVAAGVFFVFEYLFACFPAIALRVPPRKAAACAAWLIAAGYLVLSGAGIPTVRAFVMVSVGLLAVLLDRRVMSLRSVAIAALAILLVRPEAILSVGFQMSFAATAALVAFFEKAGRHPVFQLYGGGPVRRFGKFILISLVTTLVAEIAIAPFALYHFQAVPLVGLGANLLAVPLVSMAIMPLLLVMLLLMPFGLAGLAAIILKPALAGLLWVAGTFGDEYGLVAYAPHARPVFLVMAFLMMSSALMLEARARVVAILVAIILLPMSFRPLPYTTLVDNGGNVVAQLGGGDEGEGIYIAGGRRGGFRDENWARFWGMAPDSKPEALDRRCDSDACLVQLDSGDLMARVKSLEGLRHSCATATIVVVPRAWRRGCRGADLILTVEDLENRGPAGLSLESGDVAWSRTTGSRPWQYSGP